MPPNRKPSLAEHSIATWIVCSTWVICAWAVIWSVLKGIAIFCREGFFRSTDSAIVRPGVETFCIYMTMMVVLFVVVCIVLLAVVLAWEWVVWAWKTPPAAGPDDCDGRDAP